MNDIERFHGQVAEAFPDADMILSSPDRDGHAWFLDIGRNRREVLVFWNQDGVFLVADDRADDDYKECDGYQDALDRVLGILQEAGDP